MDQTRFEEILNQHIFNPEEKATLLRKIAQNPDRYIGIFRSTAPRLKLFQNLLQSREIRFGDGMEEVISELLAEKGFIHQPKRLPTSADEEKSCDQYFFSPNILKYYLVEQKVRDDHDSSKKKGQFKNFEDKIVYLKSIHGSTLIGVMYFIDPSLKKNRHYYEAELSKLSSELDVPLYLFYDGELFDFLEIPDVWQFLKLALPKWQQSVPVNIEFDYDNDLEESWRVIQTVEIGVWYKLIMNDALWEGQIVQALFSKGAVLKLLLNTFNEQGTSVVKIGRHKVAYAELASLLEKRIRAAYGHSLNSS